MCRFGYSFNRIEEILYANRITVTIRFQYYVFITPYRTHVTKTSTNVIHNQLNTNSEN